MKKIISFICISLLLIVDQVFKYLIVLNYEIGEGFDIIKNILCIEYVQNTGAAWGMMPNGTLFFMIFALIVTSVLVYILVKIPNVKKYRFLEWTMVFLISGAVGNLIDRAFRRFVVDFIYVKVIDFPVFNIADIYITLSGIALVILILFYYKDEDFDFIRFKSKKLSKDNIKEKENKIIK